MTRQKNCTPLARCLLGLAASWLAIAAAGASDNGPGPGEPSDAAPEANVTIGNITVGVNPKTGALRPLSKTELANLRSEMSRLFKARQLERIVKPDGSLAAVVAPNVLDFSVVRIEQDGTLTRKHVAGEQEALDFLTYQKAAAATVRAQE
jgi:hypothetical protein